MPTKVCTVKAMVFSVVTYRCENWTIKKAERQRTDAFKLWCWRKLLRVPWAARRSNQLIVKEINFEYSSGRTDAVDEAPILWPPDVKSQVTGKTLILGKIDGRRRRGQLRMRSLDGIIHSMDMILSKLREIVKDREDCCVLSRFGHV